MRKRLSLLAGNIKLNSQTMESNTKPIEAAAAPRSIRWRQVLAAILLCSPFFISMARAFVLPTLFDAGWSHEQIGICNSIIHTLPQLIAWLLLIGIAANRMTRVAVGVMAGWILFSLVLSILGYMGVFPDGGIGNLMSLLDSFVFIYAFSILLRNNEIAESRRKWILLLPISHLYGVVWICATVAQNAVPEGFAFGIEHVFLVSSGFQWFMYILRLLLWIAYFKMTHSEAFAPTYYDTPAPAGAYSPATKYMAMPIICGLLCFALSWTLYHFADVLV